MKLKLPKNPLWTTIGLVYVGAVLTGASYAVNGASSFYFGSWAHIAGLGLMTIGATLYHGYKEASRRIPRSHKWYRVLYRSAFFVLLSTIPHEFLSVGFLNQFFNLAFLFGILFDPIRNYYAGDHWLYHGGNSWYDKLVKKEPLRFLCIEIACFLITGYVLLIV